MGSFHARSLATLPDVDIVAIADPNEPAARMLAQAIGGAPTTDGMAVAAMADLDGLVIASPEDTHEALAMAAFGNGTQVLCEKPLAVGAVACKRIVDAEVEMGRRLLQLGLMRVYDPAHVQLAVETAQLGTLHHVRCVHRNVHEVRRTAQLILNQSLVHDIHSLRWLTGRQIIRVTTLATPNPDSVDHLLVTAEFEGGGHATIEFSEHSFAYEVSVEVEGQHGGAVMAPVMRTTVRRDGGSGVHIGTDWFERFRGGVQDRGRGVVAIGRRRCRSRTLCLGRSDRRACRRVRDRVAARTATGRGRHTRHARSLPVTLHR